MAENKGKTNNTKKQQFARKIFRYLFLLILIYILLNGVLEIALKKNLTTDDVLTLLLIFSSGLALIVTIIDINRVDKFEYEDIRQETTEVLENNEKQYSDKLIEMNYKYLDQYYYQTKVHADRSFIMASVASVIGLILLSIGIWLMFINKIGTAYVTSTGGVIIEFIAGVFFYLYNKTIAKMYQYHQKLLISQNISTSLKLAEEIEDDSKKETIKLIIDRLTLNVNELLAKEEQK